eukprot:SAG11_NODE_2985_length_2790_cov_5.176886_1_plen_160_part_00
MKAGDALLFVDCTAHGSGERLRFATALRLFRSAGGLAFVRVSFAHRVANMACWCPIGARRPIGDRSRESQRRPAPVRALPLRHGLGNLTLRLHPLRRSAITAHERATRPPDCWAWGPAAAAWQPRGGADCEPQQREWESLQSQALSGGGCVAAVGIDTW